MSLPLPARQRRISKRRPEGSAHLWLYPAKNGAFGARVLVGSGEWNAMRSIIAVGDWSGGGRPDLLAVNGKDWFYRYEGHGNGGLQPAMNCGTWPARNGSF
ncbi:hypothetical protein ABZ572_30920 [Streptomyces sp. NPDC018338]|uniref:hypothetical protein n=1 Tax=Streptomyces sp. NPDC018338 TaxID=3157192 RepID=UPI0033E7C0F0